MAPPTSDMACSPSAQPGRSFRSPSGLAVPALTDQEEQRIARQVEQLRACAGDYTTLHEELLRKRLAWWEANGGGVYLSSEKGTI